MIWQNKTYDHVCVNLYRHNSGITGPTVNISTLCNVSFSLIYREKSYRGDVVLFFFRLCIIEMVFNRSRVRYIPICKCKISVTGCRHISYSWPGESRILPYTWYDGFFYMKKRPIPSEVSRAITSKKSAHLDTWRFFFSLMVATPQQFESTTR